MPTVVVVVDVCERPEAAATNGRRNCGTRMAAVVGIAVVVVLDRPPLLLGRWVLVILLLVLVLEGTSGESSLSRSVVIQNFRLVI